MMQPLTRRQSVILGLVVILAVALSIFGLSRVAARQGLWRDTVELTVGFPEAHDVTPGTPVRLRGLDVGQVVGVDYPDHDGEGAEVQLRLAVDARYADRIYADGFAQIHSTGLLGSKVIAITPGRPGSGPLAGGRLKSRQTPDLAHLAAQLGNSADKIGATADEAKNLIKDARTGSGTLAKLLQDDGLYVELTGLAKDSRHMVKRADDAVGVVEQKAADVDKLVQDGRDTLRSIKQGTDAVQKMPLIRSYVANAAAILTRPDCRRETVVYRDVDIFKSNSAILTDSGRQHLNEVAAWLRGIKNDKAEVVIETLHDPASKQHTPASAEELTKKQAEAIVEYLRTHGAGKTGWFTRRKLIALGLGHGPSPLVEKKPMPPSYVQFHLLLPQ